MVGSWLSEHRKGRLGQHGYRTICGNPRRVAAPNSEVIRVAPSVGVGPVDRPRMTPRGPSCARSCSLWATAANAQQDRGTVASARNLTAPQRGEHLPGAMVPSAMQGEFKKVVDALRSIGDVELAERFEAMLRRL